MQGAAKAHAQGAADTDKPEGKAMPDYLCVLDFEATCDDKQPRPYPQEIIEFPTLLLNVQTGQVEAEFHHYITPDVHPQLTTFCTELTGITQEMVTDKVSLKEALRLHRAWRDGLGIRLHDSEAARANPQAPTFLYLTCGDWDLKTCLPKQLRYHGQKPESEYRAWINVKWAFGRFYGHSKPGGMVQMLSHLGMELEGRHHSGIDDCRNIARICAQMLRDGWPPAQQTFPSRSS